jgi:hypothetical protein
MVCDREPNHRCLSERGLTISQSEGLDDREAINWIGAERKDDTGRPRGRPVVGRAMPARSTQRRPLPAADQSLLAGRVLRHQAAGGPGVDGLTWEAMRKPGVQTSRVCTHGSNGERIGHSRPGDSTYRSRTAGSVRSRSRPWKTRLSTGLRQRTLDRSPDYYGG